MFFPYLQLGYQTWRMQNIDLGEEVLGGETEDEELEWRPKAGLVSDLEAHVGAMSRGE